MDAWARVLLCSAMQLASGAMAGNATTAASKVLPFAKTRKADAKTFRCYARSAPARLSRDSIQVYLRSIAPDSACDPLTIPSDKGTQGDVVAIYDAVEGQGRLFRDDILVLGVSGGAIVSGFYCADGDPNMRGYLSSTVSNDILRSGAVEKVDFVRANGQAFSVRLRISDSEGSCR